MAGVLSVAMLVMHGACYLRLRLDGELQLRAARAARVAGIVVLVAFAAAGLWVAYGIDGYRITSTADANAALNVLAKTVVKAPGAWLDNYGRHPWMMVAPVLAFSGALVARECPVRVGRRVLRRGREPNSDCC